MQYILEIPILKTYGAVHRCQDIQDFTSAYATYNLL